MEFVGRYLFRVGIAFDQLCNTLTGGYPDETVSSRLGKNQGNSRLAAVLCKVLDWFDPGHCQDAIEDDEGAAYKRE